MQKVYKVLEKLAENCDYTLDENRETIDVSFYTEYSEATKKRLEEYDRFVETFK